MERDRLSVIDLATEVSFEPGGSSERYRVWNGWIVRDGQEVVPVGSAGVVALLNKRQEPVPARLGARIERTGTAIALQYDLPTG